MDSFRDLSCLESNTVTSLEGGLSMLIGRIAWPPPHVDFIRRQWTLVLDIKVGDDDNGASGSIFGGLGGLLVNAHAPTRMRVKTQPRSVGVVVLVLVSAGAGPPRREPDVHGAAAFQRALPQTAPHIRSSVGVDSLRHGALGLPQQHPQHGDGRGDYAQRDLESRPKREWEDLLLDRRSVGLQSVVKL